MNILRELVTPALLLLLLDSVYLSLLKNMFVYQVLQVQKTPIQIRFTGVMMCYLFLIAGLWYFIIRTKQSPVDAGFLGLFVYGVFDTTMYSLFRNWDLKVAIIDTIWGGVLFYSTTFLTYKINSV
jgi:uncharacterized membrane protein